MPSISQWSLPLRSSVLEVTICRPLRLLRSPFSSSLSTLPYDVLCGRWPPQKNLSAADFADRQLGLAHDPDQSDRRITSPQPEDSLLLLAVVPTWLVSAVLSFASGRSSQVAQHLAVLRPRRMHLCRTQLCSVSTKFPFTCSYLPGKSNFQFVFWAFVIALLPLIVMGARVRRGCSPSPGSTPV